MCTGDAPSDTEEEGEGGRDTGVCGWRRDREGSTPFALVPGASRGEGRHGSRKWVAGWLARSPRKEHA